MSTCSQTERVLRLLERPADDAEAHLAGCEVCQLALEAAAGELRLPAAAEGGDEPPAGLLDRLRAMRPVPAEQPIPKLPGFEILDVLGRGGSAVVYKARHVGLGKMVALKVLSSEHTAHPDAVARARRGVEAIAAMDHPGIVRMMHVGHHEGTYFGVIEYVEGGSLSRLLEAGPIPTNEAARLAQNIAEAVQHIHERGYLHRDLKPSNVLLCRRASCQLARSEEQAGSSLYEPKIADFGLARRLDAADELTGPGLVVGTPGTMAPEQAYGEARLGPTADIWAVGVILYQMLTGRPPFDAESTTELLGRAAHDTPEPPSRLAANVPADLEHICLLCLRKDPRDRYQTAAALALDLGYFLADMPLQARQASPTQRLRRWASRHRMLVALIAVLLLTFQLMSCLGLIAFHDQRERSEQLVHSLRLDLARERLERGDRAGAWEILERCPESRRNSDWAELWKRCQPRD